jgi:DNA segregation ATPase FtsK/SpoIIIE-like protein
VTTRRTAVKRPGTVRPAAPRPLARHEREALGLTLIGAGVIVLVAMLRSPGPLLAAVRTLAFGGFGYGWPLAVLVTMAAGVLCLWSGAPRLPRDRTCAGLAAGLSLLGLLSLASAPAGGVIGHLVAVPIERAAGGWGALLILLMVLTIAAILAMRASPGALVQDGLHLLGAVRQARPRPVTGLPASLTDRVAAHGRLAEPAATEADWASPQPVATSDVEALEPLVGEGNEADTGWRDGGLRDGQLPLPVAHWTLPPLTLLGTASGRPVASAEVQKAMRVIEETLSTFGVMARILEASVGPAVTRYELQPAAGVAVKKVVALQNDLSLALAAAPLRIEAPIPGKAAIGIEVPNSSPTLVAFRQVVESREFQGGGHALGLALGKDVVGEVVTGDLARMPHLLIAGATGQGKSVAVNVLISSLLMRHTPEDLRLVLVDPKRVELQGYGGLPHLATKVIVEPHEAAAALRWATVEMERRYKLLASAGARNIAAYRMKAAGGGLEPMPYVVVVIDELADLMMVAAGEVEQLICRIAQLARAVGIHLVIATQRPSTDIITGLIKANIPSRIAFAVGSQVDSRVILDVGGAEKLLGRGDMLYLPVDQGKPIRLQGAFLDDREVDAVCRHWTEQGQPLYLEGVLDDADRLAETMGGQARGDLDSLFGRAARAVAAEGAASVSLVQRKLNVGYARAGRIVDQLAEHRVVGAYQGSKSREILMSLPDVDELLERLGVEG